MASIERTQRISGQMLPAGWRHSRAYAQGSLVRHSALMSPLTWMGQWLLNPPWLPHPSLDFLKRACKPPHAKKNHSRKCDTSRLQFGVRNWTVFLTLEVTLKSPPPPFPEADSRAHSLGSLLVSPARIWAFGVPLSPPPWDHSGPSPPAWGLPRKLPRGRCGESHFLTVSSDPSASNTGCLLKPPLEGLFPWDSQISVANAHYPQKSSLSSGPCSRMHSKQKQRGELLQRERLSLFLYKHKINKGVRHLLPLPAPLLPLEWAFHWPWLS